MSVLANPAETAAAPVAFRTLRRENPPDPEPFAARVLSDESFVDRPLSCESWSVIGVVGCG
jgi:hypothetical protein